MITIAIAACNVELFIEKAILSALNQDYPELEILLIDDNSQDKTYDIVEQISRTHPRGSIIRIIRNNPNRGTANVRNQCIDEAKGEYIFFLDGDDYIVPNAISTLYRKAVESQAEMVMGAHCRFAEGFSGEVIVNTYRFKPGIIKGDYAIAQLLQDNHTDYYPVALWNKLFRMSFIRDNNIRCVPAHFIWEDIYFAFQTSLKLRTVAVVEDVTLMWRRREGSAIRSTVTKDRMNVYISILDQILKDIAHERVVIRNDRQIPVGLFFILSNRYLTGFITRGVMGSDLLRREDKCLYLKHISMITKTSLKMRDLFSIKDRLMFQVLKCNFRYWPVKVLLSYYHL